MSPPSPAPAPVHTAPRPLRVRFFLDWDGGDWIPLICLAVAVAGVWHAWEEGDPAAIRFFVGGLLLSLGGVWWAHGLRERARARGLERPPELAAALRLLASHGLAPPAVSRWGRSEAIHALSLAAFGLCAAYCLRRGWWAFLPFFGVSAAHSIWALRRCIRRRRLIALRDMLREVLKQREPGHPGVGQGSAGKSS